MNYCRTLLMACLLSVAALTSAASAQGAAADTSKARTDSATVRNADTSAAKTAPRGRDIDALLADDDGEEFLAGYKPAVHAKDTVLVDSSVAAQPSVADAPAGSEGAAVTEQVGPAVPVRPAAPGGGRRGAPDAVVTTRSVEAGPAVIEDGHTINFAHNLKEYRSPRLAMLLSLLVPGLGQAYSRSYIKAGAFGATEIAIIGIAAYLNSEGKSRKRKAHRFADENFDVEQMRKYEADLRQEYLNRVEDTSKTPFPVDYDSDFYNAATNKQSYYYESIREGRYTPGWRDNEFSFDTILALHADPSLAVFGRDSSKYVAYFPDNPLHFFWLLRVVDNAGNMVFDGPLQGYSENQAKYSSMVKGANSYHDAVNYMFYALLINHIGSAIDAGFTARAYNARLLGNEASVWDRLSVSHQYVFSGSEVSPGLMLMVRF